MLFIVSTPIGNLSDISFRAVEVLKSVDLILVEDSRRSGVLLKEFSILTNKCVFHDHNKERLTPKIIDLLGDDKSVALICDAGTPCINDPGFYLVRQAINRGVRVSPIPGASAFLSALVCSGLPSDKFTFHKIVYFMKISNSYSSFCSFRIPVINNYAHCC